LFIADEPSVLHTEDGHVRIGFLREPALELLPNSAQAPKILFLAADFDVRPCPIKTAMIHVIRGEVVGSYRIESLRYRTGAYL